MRTRTGLLLIGLLTVVPLTSAQGPGRDGGPPAQGGGDDLVARMMKFDKDGDGKLSRDEVTDSRLNGLFTRADADKDGVVTKDELTALAAKEAPARGRGGPGRGGPGGPPRIGQVMPAFFQEMLGLTDAQKKEIDALQKDVDARLQKILTAEQRKQIQEMSNRGPGFGPGGPPPGGFGPGGPGGPGGPPPAGPGGPPPDRTDKAEKN